MNLCTLRPRKVRDAFLGISLSIALAAPIHAPTAGASELFHLPVTSSTPSAIKDPLPEHSATAWTLGSSLPGSDGLQPTRLGGLPYSKLQPSIAQPYAAPIAPILAKISAKMLKRGTKDVVDISKFNKNLRGTKDLGGPKGWRLSDDRDRHGPARYKLKDDQGRRVATLDENGKVIKG